MATDDAAEAEVGFLPRFLGAVCGGAGGSCSDFLFLPGRDLGTRAGDTTCRELPHQQVTSTLLPLFKKRQQHG